MYCKLVSHKMEILKSNPRLISDILATKVNVRKIELIVNAYKQKNNPNFNSDDFFSDLCGYLKYLELKPFCPSAGYFLKEDKQREVIIDHFFQKYGYRPSEKSCYGIGYSKKVYLIDDGSKIVRFYYANSANFFLKKLLGVSEADVSQAINNNLLTVSCVNVPGEPIDIVERVLPLSHFIYDLYLKKNSNIIKKIEKASESNVLITDFIEQSSSNVGLAVRVNNRGTRKVYVVAFDLELREGFITGESEQEIFSRMKKQCSASKPKFIDYEKIIAVVPAVEQLYSWTVQDDR